ncbi:MAG: NAD(P)/FAD-dependent oxidoreductase, partial [bacterium]|nr:NAD(P)/FAD-dependent oxidoreductase [bacterium]
MAAGSSMLPLGATGQEVLAALEPSYYPPARTGLRGSHPGSNDHAHSRAWTQRSEWGPTTDLKEEYDLVVVGGGLSGLAVAYFYQQKHGKDKKVLILDNHDDFGGHAQRNEHTINGNTRITYGGSQTLVDPSDGSAVVL